MPKQNILDDKLTPEELAAELGITERTLYRWEARRVGPPRIKVGRLVFYRRDAVEAWLREHEQAQPRAGRAA